MELIALYDGTLREDSSTGANSLGIENIALDKSPMLKESAENHLRTMLMYLWLFEFLHKNPSLFGKNFKPLTIVEKIAKCERKIVDTAPSPYMRPVLKQILQKNSQNLWKGISISLKNSDQLISSTAEDTTQQWLSNLLREKLKHQPISIPSAAAKAEVQQKETKDLHGLTKTVKKGVQTALKSLDPKNVATLQNINKITNKLVENSSHSIVIDGDGNLMCAEEYNNKVVREMCDELKKSNPVKGKNETEKLKNLFEKLANEAIASGKFQKKNFNSLKKVLKKFGGNNAGNDVNKLVEMTKLLENESTKLVDKSGKIDSDRFLSLTQKIMFDGESSDEDERQKKSSTNKPIYPPFTLDTINDCILALSEVISPIDDVERENFIYLTSPQIEVRDLNLVFVEKASAEASESDEQKRLTAIEENFLFTVYRTIVYALKQNENNVEKSHLNGLIERNKRIFVDIILRSKRFEQKLRERNARNSNVLF